MVTVSTISMVITDWKHFLSLGKSYLGRDLASILDATHSNPATLASYVTMLESLAGRNVQPQVAIGQAINSLRHVSFGFAILGEIEEINAFMELASSIIAITADPEGKFIIATGTLEAWKWLILNKDSVTVCSRNILLQVASYLEQAGFKNLWNQKLV